MVDEARKIFLAGIGTAALSCEKAGDIVSKLIEKGKLSIDEGKELSEELKHNMSNKTEEAKETVMKKVEDVKPLTKSDLIDILQKMGYPTKADIANIEKRLNDVEEKLQEKKEDK